MIPMIDLGKQWEEIGDEVNASVREVLGSSRYVLGPRVEELEKGIAEYVGASEAIGVASGTDALHLAVKALGIGEDDEVITTPFTFFATVESILYERARPVFVDIEPDTFNIDPSAIEKAITGRTKAIMPAHMFGHPADMPRIMDIARRHGLKVIEDCAQAFGALAGGMKAGGIGDAGCYSFYPSKNLGACGDGGMITLADPGTAGLVRRLRNHGSSGGYLHTEVGINSRLDEVQAAILLVKFRRIDRYNSLRRKKADLYTRLLSGAVVCPSAREGFEHVYHQYTITSPERDRVKERLASGGISSMVYYPLPLHLQPALSFLGHKEGDFPVAERASRSVLSLPICPEIEDGTVERIAETIKGCF